MKIIQTKFTNKAKGQIDKGFAEHNFSKLGLKDLVSKQFLFEAREGGELLGSCAVQVVYGQLYIRTLFIEEKYRGQGLGTKLMSHAFKYGKKKGCDFVYLETMDFQAPEFYKKHGFTVEFVRSGFVKGTKRYHMRKDLN
jgi:ribosomal protein S18 acetylase RimI-like enzyme